MNSFFNALKLCTTALVTTCLVGCAQSFPRPNTQSPSEAFLDGQQIFTRSFKAHGGDSIDQLKAIDMTMQGEWGFWITRIQPLVSDYQFRVKSRESLSIGSGGYQARYTGPGGTKVVKRTPNSIAVFYNGIKNEDTDVLTSSAMTADGFYLFALGPLAFANRNVKFQRLSDDMISGQSYYRIYAQLLPGFGLSKSDEVILWIDPKNFLVKRYGITLNGFTTTQRAWVDVTIYDYESVGDFVFPKDLYERVRAPISIGAHQWEYSEFKLSTNVQ